MDINAIRLHWESGEISEAARAIEAVLQDRLRPGWAADILALTCTLLSHVPPELQAVIQIGRDPLRLREAHAAFSAVRRLTLLADESGTGGNDSIALGIGEDAAKVIYNASGLREPVPRGVYGPFDEDCGYWLGKGFCYLARTQGSPSFAESAWAIQETWLRRASC